MGGEWGDVGVLLGLVGFGLDRDLVKGEILLIFWLGLFKIRFYFFELILSLLIIQISLILRQHLLNNLNKLLILF